MAGDRWKTLNPQLPTLNLVAGKAASAGTHRRGLHGDDGGPEEHHCAGAGRFANRQCGGVLCRLPAPDGLPAGAGGFVPVSARSSRVGNHTGSLAGGCHFGRGVSPAAKAALFIDGLAVVSGNARSGNRTDPVRNTRPCGSLHLSAADRFVFRLDLGGGGFVRRLASPPGGAGRRFRDHSGGFDFLRAHSDLILAK